MARDGSGNYSRVEGPYINGAVADAEETNNELDDISSAISDSINKAGTKAFAANQSMGGFKLTDVATATNNTDAANKAYVDAKAVSYAQPLDATLTALAALSWSSGSPVLQFTAADTVSLTLTPSVSSVTASQGAASTTPSATFTNTNDTTPVRVLRLDGDRATPTQFDEAYIAGFLSNGAGTQTEYVRFKWNALAITNGAEDGAFILSLKASGSMGDKYVFAATAFRPNSNNGAALGASGTAWSGGFFASGAALDFNAGNFTLTHVTGGIEANGTVRARVPLSSETGTPTSASLNKKVALASAPTINSIGTADDFILFDPGTSSRVFTRGAGMTMYLNGSDAASATLAANQFGTVHWRSSTVAILSGAFS